MKSDLRDFEKNFNVDIPYPEIMVDKENLSYANFLQEVYAGITSEFTMFNQYRYHASIISEDYPDIDEVLKGISKVGLKHLEILADLIVVLGGNPGYWITKKNKKLYWSPTFIKYVSTAESILTEDINVKKLSIVKYKALTQKIEEENINAILNRLILDEEYHLNLLQKLYDKYVIGD